MAPLRIISCRPDFDNNQITVKFSEAVARAEAEDVNNYRLISPIGAAAANPDRAVRNRADTVTLDVPANFFQEDKWVKLEVDKAIMATSRARFEEDYSRKHFFRVRPQLAGAGRGAGVAAGGGAGAAGGMAADIADAIRNATAYPFLTTNGAPVSGGSATTAIPSLQRTVEGALRTVLGRVPKQGDARSFVAALNQSFAVKDVEGRTEWSWTPRTYAGQTDLGGGVTGAQASLVTFARSALSSSLPLLDGLYSLLPDADEEEVEAARTILRQGWIEFVNELETEGGPRAPRANQISERLKQQLIPKLGALLGMVKVVNGQPQKAANTRPMITRANVITPDEEVNLTNFIALADYIFAVDQSWDSYRTDFFQADLGSGLVLLSRALSVTAETVDEITAAMDSVFVGPAERMVAKIDLQGPYKDMVVEELLSWITTFASNEAPMLVQDGGKRGVEAILPTADLFRELVGQFIWQIDTGKLPTGLQQQRVKNPLNELMDYLNTVVQRADNVATLS